MDAPSFNDLFNEGRAEVLMRNGNIKADVIDREGSDVNLMLAAGAAMAQAAIREQDRRFQNLLLARAKGQDLDYFVFDRYGIVRKPAAAAVGTVNFSRPTYAAGAVVIPSGFRVGSTNGREYATIMASSLGATALSVTGIPVQAIVAGADSNAVIGTITRIISAISDTSIVVANTSAITGGDDEEDDDAFRQRVKMFFVTSRRGTISAIEFGAKSYPGVRQAVASEVTEPDGAPSRMVQMYIADKDGYASRVLIAAVANSLEEYRAAGIKVFVLGGAPYYQSVQIELAFPTGVDQSQVASDVKNAIVAAINALAPGETLQASSIIFAARGVNDAIVGRLLLPLGDIVPTSEQVIRTTYDRVEVFVVASPGNVYQGTSRAVPFGGMRVPSVI